jgi:hypothetical protein
MIYLRALSLWTVIGWTLGSRWDTGLDGNLLGEAVAPTDAPNVDLKLQPDPSFGSAPLPGAPGASKRRRKGKEGRLDYRGVSIAKLLYLATTSAYKI